MGMMKTNFRWVNLIFIVFILAGASFLLSNETKAADLTVGSGCTYPTIADAIAAANPGDTLMVEGERTFTENITIPINLTLQGGYTGCDSGSSARTIINGGGLDRVFEIFAGLDVALENLNITNGNAVSETGGGIRFANGAGTGNLTLTNVDIYDNTANSGGGLWVGMDAEVIGENVRIRLNTADVLGGGVQLFGGRATLVNSYIHDNSAPLGGGLYATREEDSAPVVHLTTSDLYYNQALSGDGLGGGVYLREGALTMLVDSDLIGNDAIQGGGAYLVTSTLTLDGEGSWIYNNTATSNGGGVYVQGSTVYLYDGAQLYDNTAQTGGGAYLDSSSLVGRKASIRYNTANLRGGGVYAVNHSTFDMGLGSYTCLGVRCSRLGNNTATTLYGGGVYLGNSTAYLRNTFIENNRADYGGGVFAYDNSAVYAYNNLFARNDAVSGTGDAVRLNLNASMTGAGNTLAYNDAGGAATGNAIGMTGGSSLALHCSIIWGHANSIDTAGQDVTYSNIQGGYAGTGNLNLDPMFVNSGSADFHLQATSPVIDRCAYFAGMDTDFDNEPRPIVRDRPATPYDMGADEFSEPRVGINGVGCAYGTVTQAIVAARDGDTIQVAEGTYFEAIDITSKDLTIVGNYENDCTTPGTGPTILDASYHSGSTVDIRNNEVTLRNLRITGGDSIGGGVDVDSDLDLNSQVTLDNVHVTGNTGPYGAGLYIGTTSVVTLINGTRIDNNTATIAGGGARVWGRLVVNSWLGGITDNIAPHGGGVSVPGGVLELRPGHVGINQATAGDGRGGGIHVLDGGVVTATNSSNVYRNSAFDGAGIYADDAQVTLLAVIHSNIAANNGGGIYLTNGSALHASNTRLGDDIVPGRGNEAANAGGGIYVQNSEVTLNSSRVLSNTANAYGGGIYLFETSVLNVLNHSVIAGNRALNNHGGGIAAAGTPTINISYATLRDNSAQRGGAIFQTGGGATSQISNSLIYGNTATAAFGAGIRSEGGEFSMTHVTLANNLNGAGYSQSNTDGHATNSIAWGNDAGGFWITSGPLDGTCNIDQSGNVGLNSNPRFVDSANSDFHLLGDSPAIDACTTGLSPDLDSVPRPQGSGYDMGAYEFYIEYDVQAASNPAGGGTISGTGTYYSGSTVTLNASANSGYVFVNWTEGNKVVSCNARYSFKLMSNRTLRANFSQVQSQYTITGTASPTNFGTVTGSGSYNHGAGVTMTALPNQGFALANWIETWPGLTGYCVVSTDERYSFSANRNRNLTANIRPKALPGVLMLLLDDE
jgi:hypothetical protein